MMEKALKEIMTKRSTINIFLFIGVAFALFIIFRPSLWQDKIETYLNDQLMVKGWSININELPDLGKLSEKIISPCGDIRTLPCHFYKNGGMDGFYIARLQKL